MASENACGHPFSTLPGDPSLILTTNVDLGDKKLEIMKGMEHIKLAKKSKQILL